MDKLIKDLLNMENAGKESLAGLEEERAAQVKQTEAEIAQYLQEINLKTSRAVEILKRDSELSLKSEMAGIENEHLQKAANLQELFDSNTESWRSELVSRVLKS